MLAASKDFIVFFSRVEDPRVERSKQHLLLDILFLCVAATIAGCDGPSEIADFGRTQLAWFRKFRPFKNGIPSHDTIGRVLALLKAEQFQQAFLDWVATFSEEDSTDSPRLVPIDGKTLRGSGGGKDHQHPLHVVSAWSTEQGLTLGQVAVDTKSNEITAIPKLLEMLELKGTIVSIDAMGCQKQIAQQIIAGGGDYVLAVKDNQPQLNEAIDQFFLARHEHEDFKQHACRQYTSTERSRGRIEKRCYFVAPVPESMRGLASQWKGVQSIGQVISYTTTDSHQTSQVRCYISSREPKVKEFARSVRGHWAIESMHWILDVVFREDSSRLRNGAVAENFSLLRKFITSLLKRDTSPGSLKGKRKRAGWSTQFLETLLFQREF